MRATLRVLTLEILRFAVMLYCVKLLNLLSRGGLLFDYVDYERLGSFNFGLKTSFRIHV